jgi:circadian clock protein KaiC
MVKKKGIGKKIVKKVKKNSVKKNPKKAVKKNREESINDINPDKKTQIKNKGLERLTSGIVKLDKIFHGGIIKNSTNLIMGDTGSGKTILALKFLISGMKRKEICLYISFEEKKEPFYRNALSLGWDLEEYERAGLFIFIEYTPGKVKTMLEEGGGIIESTILNKNVQRVVIDSITSFTLLFENETEKRELSLSLFNMLRKWDCTTFLTYSLNPALSNDPTSKTVEFEADSIILLYFDRGKQQRKRFLEVIKMRGTDHSKKIYPFVIEKNGVKISNKYVSKIS